MAGKLTEEKFFTDEKQGDQEDVDHVSGQHQKPPRLPHERDESLDSQEAKPRKDMKQAFDDIEAGQMDTDRRGMPGVEEVERKKPGNVQEDIPASSRMPPSVPKQ
ncbi:hypothetical protein ACIQW9_11645 [Herminiimonas sp. NPDC097707]|uniref:hypothetical protein n=1 Tax=Herminiimonas sp. NPDC097707 TaxID=3364007 RepID=UPI00383AB01A